MDNSVIISKCHSCGHTEPIANRGPYFGLCLSCIVNKDKRDEKLKTGAFILSCMGMKKKERRK